MKKTNEELLKFFGLKVGDKIKVDSYYYPFIIAEENSKIFAKRENCLSSWDYYDIGTLTDVLLNCDYEIITPKKKIGDMRCGDFETCKECPFRLIHCGNNDEQVLFDIFNDLKRYLCGDEEIEAIIEKRLNEEVQKNARNKV